MEQRISTGCSGGYRNKSQREGTKQLTFKPVSSRSQKLPTVLPAGSMSQHATFQDCCELQLNAVLQALCYHPPTRLYSQPEAIAKNSNVFRRSWHLFSRVSTEETHSQLMETAARASLQRHSCCARPGVALSHQPSTVRRLQMSAPRSNSASKATTTRCEDGGSGAERSQNSKPSWQRASPSSATPAQPVSPPSQAGNAAINEAELARETFAGRVAILFLGVRICLSRIVVWHCVYIQCLEGSSEAVSYGM